MTGSRKMVLSGMAHHTSGGLTASDLVRTKSGRIASKKKIAAAKKNPGLRAWAKAFKKVRDSYIKEGRSTSGFTPLKKSSPEYKEVRALYDKMMQ